MKFSISFFSMMRLFFFNEVVSAAFISEQELVQSSAINHMHKKFFYSLEEKDSTDTNQLNSIDDDTFLENIITNHSFLAKSSYSNYCRNIAKSLALLFGSTSGIPLIILAKNASKNYETLGLIFAGATVFNIGVSRSWGLLQLISEENLLKLEGTNKKTFYAKIIFAHTIGFLSSLPFSYTVYHYNRGIPKYLTLSTLFAEYGLATYGYMELFSGRTINLLNCKTYNNYDSLSQNYVDSANTISALNNVVSNLICADPLERKEKINNLTQFIDLGMEKDFLNILLDMNKDEESNSCYKTFAKLMICTIPLSNAFQNTIMSLNSSKAFNNSLWFSLGYTFATVTPSLTLGILMSRDTISNMYDSIYSVRNKNFLNKYHPNFYKSIIILSLLSSCLTASGSMFLSYDVIKNSILSDFATYFTIINGIGIVILESYVMRHVLENLLLMYLKEYGTEEEKKILKIKEKAENLHLVLKHRAKK